MSPVFSGYSDSSINPICDKFFAIGSVSQYRQTGVTELHDERDKTGARFFDSSVFIRLRCCDGLLLGCLNLFILPVKV